MNLSIKSVPPQLDCMSIYNCHSSKFNLGLYLSLSSIYHPYSATEAVPVPAVSCQVLEEALPGHTLQDAHGGEAVPVRHLLETVQPEVLVKYSQNYSHGPRTTLSMHGKLPRSM